MTDVSCIGLGLMGSALARAFLKSGCAVTAWNRTSSRARPLVDLGATPALDFRRAVEASPITLFCVDNYETTRSLLLMNDATELLKGRTIVQLSTGTPIEARLSNNWFLEQGAEYLDGAILGGPAAIGTPRVQILYAGSDATFSRIKPILTALGEKSRFVGSDPGTAAVIDFAWLANRFGIYLSAAYGAMLCEAEGVDLGEYAEVFTREEPARWIVEVIREDNFSNPSATLSVWNASLQMIQRQVAERKVDNSFPNFVADVLNRAERAGLGSQHIAAMVKIFRGLSSDT